MTIRSIITAMPLPLYEAEGAGAGGADKGAGAGEGDKGADKGGAGDKGGAAAGAEGEKGKTALEGGGAGKEQVVTITEFGDNWHELVAGKDKKLADEAKRYKSPTDMLKSLVETKAALRGGKGDEPMPDPEKDADGAKAWREERGIPEAADKYALSDPVKKAIEGDDASKPLVDGALEHFHKLNWPNGQVNQMLEFYFGLEAATQADRDAADEKLAGDTAEFLRQELGTQYRPQITLAKQFATEITPGIDWFTARMPDGRRLGDIPEVVMALAKLGEKEYGDAHYAGSEAAAKSTGRKEEIEKIMRTDMRAYRGDKKMQAEYRELVEADQRRAARR